jgi:hypothetical protein
MTQTGLIFWISVIVICLIFVVCDLGILVLEIWDLSAFIFEKAD